MFWFLLSAAVYLSSFRWHGGDDIPTSLLPFSLLHHGTFYLDEWARSSFLAGKTNDFAIAVGDHFISFYPVASAILAVPLYIVPVLAHAPITEMFVHNLSKVSAALITAVSVAVLYQALAGRASRSWAACVTAFYAFGTWSLSLSSQALYQHGPASLGQALGVLGLSREGRRWDWLAGFGFALSVAARPDTVWPAAAVGAYLLFHRRRRVPAFIAGALIPAALLLAYWHWAGGRFAPPDAARQSHYFTSLQPEALLAMLVSPTHGILFFSPFLLFAVWGAFRPGASAESRWLVAGSGSLWFFLGFYSFWVGGSTFGPRYLAGTAVPLAFACAELEPWIRSSAARLNLWALAGSFSIAVHALGAYLTWPGTYHIDLERWEVWRWSYHPALNLLVRHGSLGGLPAAVRALIFAAFIAAIAAGYRHLLQALS